MGDETRAPIPEGYLPLTPAVLDIMVALGEEEMHGYAIMREVRRRTQGRRRLAPGTLYRSLKQMHERGLLEARSKGFAPSGRPSGAGAGAR
jgi:DNA-binding PadR family transcriptional regulator